MFVLFLRLLSVCTLLLYLTDSPDRLTEDEPAAWTWQRLERWMRGADTNGTWWELCAVTSELYRMGLINKHERDNGWVWEWVYRRAVGRPLPYSQDHHYGTRELHPKP